MSAHAQNTTNSIRIYAVYYKQQYTLALMSYDEHVEETLHSYSTPPIRVG